MSTESQEDPGVQISPGDDGGSDKPIATQARDCDSNFVKSITYMVQSKENGHAGILRALHARFTDWGGYLGVFSMKSASLDRRLERNKHYRDLVLLVLSMLNSRLLQTMEEPEETDSDSSSDEEENRREIELASIQTSINELFRLAVSIRQSSTSPLDARVKAFGARKPSEVAAFERVAMIAINGLYPKASSKIRQRLIMSMTQQYTRLLYWNFHDKKLRFDSRDQSQNVDEHSGSQLDQPRVQHDNQGNQRHHVAIALPQAPRPELPAIRRGFSILSDTNPSIPGSRLLPPQIADMIPRQRRSAATTTVLPTGFNYPRPPKAEQLESHKPCPYCRKLFPSSDFADDVWWRKHINNDFFPYVCISSTCPENPVYASRTEWKSHMSRDHDDVLSTVSATSNDNSPKNAQNEAGMESNPKQKEDLCPLCSYLPSNNGRQSTAGKESTYSAGGLHDDPKIVMLDHIADHLQFLSLLTPRLLIDKLDNSILKDFSSSKATSKIGTPSMRSTLGASSETPQETDEDAVTEAGPLDLDDTHGPYEVPPDSTMDVWSDVTSLDAAPTKDKFLEDLILSGAFHSQRTKAKRTLPQYSIEDKACLDALAHNTDENFRFWSNPLKESDRWILYTHLFQLWCVDPKLPVIRLRYDNDQGISKLVDGIITELKRMSAFDDTIDHVAYCFCEAGNMLTNNATSVICGLMRFLINQNPSLLPHLRQEYDISKGALFYGPESWTSLSNIFHNMLQEPSLPITYLVIDSIDECISGLSELLDFVYQFSAPTGNIKWLLSGHISLDIVSSLHFAGIRAIPTIEVNVEPATPRKSGNGIKEPALDPEQMRCLRLLRLGSTNSKNSTYEWYKDSVDAPAENSLYWLPLLDSYQKWMAQDSGLLLFTAPRQFGKSVLAKYLVDSGLPTQSTTISYFFSHSGENMTVRQALCALLYQLFCWKPGLIKHVVEPFLRSGPEFMRSKTLLWTVLQNTVRDPEAGPIRIILDGLGWTHLPDDDISDLLKNFMKLIQINDQNPLQLKIFVAARPDEINPGVFGDLQQRSSCFEISEKEIAEVLRGDIDRIVDSSVERFARNMRLSDTTERRLKSKLSSVPTHTYSWLALFIRHLESCIDNANEIMNDVILRLPPMTADEAYKQMLYICEEPEMASKISCIATVAKRPLSLEEMNVALSIADTIDRNAELLSIQSLNLKSEDDHALSYQGPVVLLSHLDRWIQLAHPLTRDYFLSEKAWQTSKQPFSARVYYQSSKFIRDANALLAKICMSFLYMFDHDVDILPAEDRRLALQDYAATYWAFHYSAAKFASDDAANNLALCLYESEMKLSRWLNIYWRAKYGTFRPPKYTGLIAASYFGHEIIVQLLVQQGANVGAMDDSGRTSLSLAARQGCRNVIDHLLKAGADIDAKDNSGRTPLSWAAGEGHRYVVDSLLQAGSDVNTKDTSGRTPLLWAASKRYRDVVDSLLQAGSDVNTKDNSGRTPLSWAAIGGHRYIVDSLLQAGSDVNTKDTSGHTPLSWAASKGYRDVVDSLLQAGSDVNTKDTSGRTPLLWAASKRYRDVVDSLLQAGSDVNTKDNSGHTPLSWAASKGYRDVVDSLLQAGSDVNTKDTSGRTPLSWAASKRHRDVVDSLLQAGSDVNTKDNSGRTPLSWAASEGRLNIVFSLFKAGSDVSNKDTSGRTPLSWAIAKGHEHVVEWLRLSGAS